MRLTHFIVKNRKKQSICLLNFDKNSIITSLGYNLKINELHLTYNLKIE